MKLNNLYLLFLFGFLFLVSCEPTIRNKEELVNYVNNPENGLNIENEVNGIKINCSYFPSILINEKLKNPSAKTEDDKFSEFVYFRIGFSKDGKELLKQLEYSLYSEMVQVLSFRMTNYIAIHIKGKEPVVPADCLFQQTYGLSNANELLVVFNKKDLENQEEFKLVVNEFGLGLGYQQFQLENKQIKDIDKIKL